MKRLGSSLKNGLKEAFRIFSKDCRTTTGSNLRNMLLENNVVHLEQLTKEAIRRTVKFHPAPAEEQWRIPVIQDLIDIRDGTSGDIGWSKDEIESTLEYLYTV